MENTVENRELLTLNVLHTRSDVIGLDRNIQLKNDVSQPFSTHNAMGVLRVVATVDEAKEIGAYRASKFKSILD